MLKSLYTTATGMKAQQTMVDMIANNIANVNTAGFKRSQASFEDLFYVTLQSPGLARGAGDQPVPIGTQIGSGTRLNGTTKVFTTGTLEITERALDVAIDGEGFFAVTLPDGSTGYTRDGGFQVDANGQLVTNAGYVVQPGITIPANALSVTIAQDGTVQVTTPGNTAKPTTVGQLQLASFANPAGLEPRGQNLYGETAASGTPNAGAPNSNGLGALQQGFVEGSNVNVVEELVSMIATQRAYELNSKAIQTSDQMLQKLGQL